jgi:hypothetical protein
MHWDVGSFRTMLVAMLVTTQLPDLLVPVPPSSHSETITTPGESPMLTSLSASTQPTANGNDHEGVSLVETVSVIHILVLEIAHMPPIPSWGMGYVELLAQNGQLQKLLDQAQYWMQKDYVLKKLMEKENEQLQQQLVRKTNKLKWKDFSSQA